MLFAGSVGFANPASAAVLVSNINKTNSTNSSLANFDMAQGFTTGSNSGGYTLTSVEISFHSAPSGISVKLATGLPSATTEVATLTNPSSLSTGTLTFDAPSNTTLSASTTYWVVVEASSGALWNALESDEDPGAASGWSIADTSNYRTASSTGMWSSEATIKKIRVNGSSKTSNTPPPPVVTAPPPPPPPPVIESPEGVSHSGNPNDGFSLTPLEEGGSIVYRKRTIDIPVTRDECTSPGNPALIISRSALDRVREITFELSGTSPEDPPPGFRMEGCVAEIDPGIRLGQRETVAVCLPPAEVKGESYVHRYDEEWKILPSRLETVNGEELVCGETNTFSLFAVFLPVIESSEGVNHSEDKEYGFSLTPLGEGGSIVYGQRTIDLLVTGDVNPSSGDPAVIVSRSVLDQVEEITFELSEVSPHDPPQGFYLEGFSAEVDLGVALEQGETVSVCLPSAGESDIYRYSEELGEWEVLPSQLETVNGEELVCGDAGAFSLTGVFVEDTGGCVIASASGEGVLWRGAVFSLLLTISVLLLVPGMSRLGVHGRKPLI